MPRTANPSAPIPDSALPEPRRPIPVPHKEPTDETDDKAASDLDPLAPGTSLFDEDEDAVEPNEPA
ncbi:MAG: hypothetical protein ABIQ73_12975 [Acidimicrobiales bacterium]